MDDKTRRDPEQPVTPPAECPTCHAERPETAPAFPFCSERCRLADLGRWFREDYKVSRGIEPDDLDELDA